MHCPHTLSSALLSINIYDQEIRDLNFENSKSAKILGTLRIKPGAADAIHCAMRPPPPLRTLIFLSGQQVERDKLELFGSSLHSRVVEEQQQLLPSISSFNWHSTIFLVLVKKSRWDFFGSISKLGGPTKFRQKFRNKSHERRNIRWWNCLWDQLFFMSLPSWTKQWTQEHKRETMTKCASGLIPA